MYKYETHLHTCPVSRCATGSVAETLEFYKSLGYDGIFITNHFLDGNIRIDEEMTYEEKINFYFSDYEEGIALSEKVGIKVFCGVELSYKGTDFLIYGLNKAWFLAHPEIMDMKKSEELTLMANEGTLVIQAHPFREASYIDHIRLFPRQVHGVEVVNTCRKESENAFAESYADHYGLLKTAGSDNHSGYREKLAGLSFEQPLLSEDDFVRRVKEGKSKIFTLSL